MNIGNPIEYTVKEVAALILELSGGASDGAGGLGHGLIYEPLPQDDPRQRCPDITRAREVLGWEPRIPAREGLKLTFDWFAEQAKEQARQKTGRAAG